MVRISGVDLPRSKRIDVGLTYIFGLGRTNASKILHEAGILPSTRSVTGYAYDVSGKSNEIKIPDIVKSAFIFAKNFYVYFFLI